MTETFGGPLDPGIWSIPGEGPSGDGSLVGRTQLRKAPQASLPPVSGNHVCLPIETFNPASTTTFLGSEIFSGSQFALGTGLDVKVRAHMDSAAHGGIVGGIFLYALKPDSTTLHDEIDFELLTNVKDMVQTNIYGNENLGDGHVELIPLKGGSITDDHDYEIRWQPGQVTWLVDGQQVRTTTDNVPTGPMAFYLNIWAPDHWWPRAYDAALQPTQNKTENQVLDALCVASVSVKPLDR